MGRGQCPSIGPTTHVKGYLCDPLASFGSTRRQRLLSKSNGHSLAQCRLPLVGHIGRLGHGVTFSWESGEASRGVRKRLRL